MNEKLQYATMLEMPVNTCNVTKVSSKKKRLIKKKKPTEEQVKNQLLDMVNNENEQTFSLPEYDKEQLDQDDNGILQEGEDFSKETVFNQTQNLDQDLDQDEQMERTVTASVNTQREYSEKTKKPFKITVIGKNINKNTYHYKSKYKNQRP